MHSNRLCLFLSYDILWIVTKFQNTPRRPPFLVLSWHRYSLIHNKDCYLTIIFDNTQYHSRKQYSDHCQTLWIWNKHWSKTIMPYYTKPSSVIFQPPSSVSNSGKHPRLHRTELTQNLSEPFSYFTTNMSTRSNPVIFKSSQKLNNIWGGPPG